jgi:hypothetical protein
MATREEAVGAALAAQALAFVSIEMLIRLGHSDLIDTLKASALETLDASVTEGTGLDREKTLEHARLILMGLTATAKANSALGAALRQ